jgi:hypothetical protein
MGLANLVPGISGGTMLLAAGVYPGFIAAIAEVTTLRFKPRSVLLLGTIVATAALGILLLAGTVKTLVVEHRWMMYSLFIGLTLGGVPLVWRMARPVSPSVAIGAAVAFGLMVAMALTGTGLVRHDPSRCQRRVPAAPPRPVRIDPGHRGPAQGGSSRRRRWLLHRYEKATLGALLGLLFGAVVGLWPFQQARAPQVGDVIKGQVVSVESASDFEPDDWPVRFFEPTPMESAKVDRSGGPGTRSHAPDRALGRRRERDRITDPPAKPALNSRSGARGHGAACMRKPRAGRPRPEGMIGTYARIAFPLTIPGPSPEVAASCRPPPAPGARPH